MVFLTLWDDLHSWRSVVLFYNSVLRSSVNLCLLTSYLTLSSGHLGRNLVAKLQTTSLTLCLTVMRKEFYYSSAGLGYWVGELHWCCAKYIKWIPYLNPTTIFSGMNSFYSYLIWRKWLSPGHTAVKCTRLFFLL